MNGRPESISRSKDSVPHLRLRIVQSVLEIKLPLRDLVLQVGVRDRTLALDAGVDRGPDRGVIESTRNQVRLRLRHLGVELVGDSCAFRASPIVEGFGGISVVIGMVRGDPVNQPLNKYVIVYVVALERSPLVLRLIEDRSPDSNNVIVTGIVDRAPLVVSFNIVPDKILENLIGFDLRSLEIAIGIPIGIKADPLIDGPRPALSIQPRQLVRGQAVNLQLLLLKPAPYYRHLLRNWRKLPIARLLLSLLAMLVQRHRVNFAI